MLFIGILERDEGIGLSTEGRSHDQPDLIEFQPGIAIFALGAAAKRISTYV
jgi:hypothetical protein